MHFTSLAGLCALLTFAPLVALGAPLKNTRQEAGISQAVFDDLTLYAEYSSAVYQFFCPSPLGNTLVEEFDIDGTQGFVVRDDTRQEIVVAFQGSLEPVDIITDIQLLLTPLDIPDVTGVGEARVHTGFQKAYNAVANEVLALVEQQLDENPTFRVVVTGHSLGGSVGTFAALQIRAARPEANVQLYTYGQPRTGDGAFTAFVEQQIGLENIFRAVHTTDLVPVIVIKELGYRHFGSEFFNFEDDAAPETIRVCVNGDDPNCSDSTFPGSLIPHVFYFGQAMALNPTLCF